MGALEALVARFPVFARILGPNSQSRQPEFTEVNGSDGNGIQVEDPLIEIEHPLKSTFEISGPAQAKSALFDMISIVEQSEINIESHEETQKQIEDEENIQQDNLEALKKIFFGEGAELQAAALLTGQQGNGQERFQLLRQGLIDFFNRPTLLALDEDSQTTAIIYDFVPNKDELQSEIEVEGLVTDITPFDAFRRSIRAASLENHEHDLVILANGAWEIINSSKYAEILELDDETKLVLMSRLQEIPNEIIGEISKEDMERYLTTILVAFGILPSESLEVDKMQVRESSTVK